MAKKLDKLQERSPSGQLPSEKPVELRAEVISITETDKGYYEVLMAVTGKVKLGQKFNL